MAISSRIRSKTSRENRDSQGTLIGRYPEGKDDVKKTVTDRRVLVRRSLVLISVALCCSLFGFSELSISTTSGMRGADTTNESETSIFKKNTPMYWIEEKEASVKENGACPAGTPLIDADQVKTWPGRRYDFQRPYELPTINWCGKVDRMWHQPYRWEAHLKKRLFDRIDQFSLKEVPFMMLDLGMAYADWALAVGAYAPQSRIVALEANVSPFRNVWKHLLVNPGIVDRIFPIMAAVMGDERVSRDSSKKLILEGRWTGPVLCDTGDDAEGVLNTFGANKKDSCPGNEIAVPMVTVDEIMSATRDPETFFVAKIDIEGAEYEAVSGGRATFLDPIRRPCIIFAELKDDPLLPYKKAFDFIVDAGYTDIEDIDSGAVGVEWPPRGAKYAKEGNYEFRLPQKEMEDCVTRVKSSASWIKPVGGAMLSKTS